MVPDCQAKSESACLVKAGCRWFSYSPGSGCRLCERWFGDQAAVTGCRFWTFQEFCSQFIFGPAQHKWGRDPASPPFKKAVRHYMATQGSGEAGNPHTKRARCNVWCDFSAPYPCFGQPRAVDEFKGVNYGGRFIPERYLGLPGTANLFGGVEPPGSLDGPAPQAPSLCDVAGTWNAAARMEAFLDANVRAHHFESMAAAGFNTVRLPLGYWNLISPPGGAAPNSTDARRWKALQGIMPPSNYSSWIDSIFRHARASSLRVLLDLHGAPGGQAGRASTGCDQGEGTQYFDRSWNAELAASAVAEMARICGRHGDSCYGIELLSGPDPSIGRPYLRDYYRRAIGMARRHVAWDKPLLVMEWPSRLPWWRDQRPFSYKEHGRVIFSTHVYGASGIKRQQTTRDAYAADLDRISNFYVHSRHSIIVSEYALSHHGPGDPRRDSFEYHSLANWFVHQFNQHGAGSAVWNFDAGKWARAWGPVALNQVGMHPIHWREIFSVAAPLPSRRIYPDPDRPAPLPGYGRGGAEHAVGLYLLMPLAACLLFLCGCRNLRACFCGCFKAPTAGTMMVRSHRGQEEEWLRLAETEGARPSGSAPRDASSRLEAPRDEDGRSLSTEESLECLLEPRLAPIPEQSQEDDESVPGSAADFWSTML